MLRYRCFMYPLKRRRVGATIKEARKGMGLTQRELAKALDVTDASVSYWEQGRNTPGSDIQRKLAARLGLTVDDLVPR